MTLSASSVDEVSLATAPENADARQQAIANAFGRAATSYNETARVQARIAADAQLALSQKHFRHVLDIGCATGAQTAVLAQQHDRITGVDISAAMVAAARQAYPALTFVQGEAEALPFPSDHFDAVYSSMALQWVSTPDVAMQEVSRVLTAAGTAQLAIMVAGSFHELVAARQQAGQQNSVNAFASALVWEKAAHQAGFTLVAQQVTRYVDEFDNIRSLLKSITKAGAGVSLNTPPGTPSSSFNRQQLQALEAAYPRTEHGKLGLTYQVLHLTLEK